MARVWVTARLDGTEIRASVVAQAEYGDNGRTATGTVEVPDQELGPLTEVLMDFLNKYDHRAENRAKAAAATAMTVAVQRGEEVL